MRKKIIKFSVLGLIAILMILGAFSVKAAGITGIKQLSEQAREKYQEARQVFSNEIDIYKNAKNTFLELQTRFKNAAEEQRDRLREQIREKSGEFLKKMISSMIRYLEAMKNKVANMRGISETDRTNALAELDEDITWLQSKQSEIDQATSTEQLREISQAVKEKWSEIRTRARRSTGLVLAARMRFIIEKLEAMADRIEKKINELEQAGEDVTELETLLADFKEKIALAEEKYEQAKAKFQEISNKEEVSQLFQEGHKLIKEANQYVRQAYNDLKQIVREIKQIENSSNLQNATTTP